MPHSPPIIRLAIWWNHWGDERGKARNWSPYISGGATGRAERTCTLPTSRHDQFSNLPKFDENMLGLGKG